MPLHPWTTAVISVTPDGRESPDLDRHNPLGGATLIKGHHLRRRLLVLSNFSGCEFTRSLGLEGRDALSVLYVVALPVVPAQLRVPCFHQGSSRQSECCRRSVVSSGAAMKPGT